MKKSLYLADYTPIVRDQQGHNLLSIGKVVVGYWPYRLLGDTNAGQKGKEAGSKASCW